MNKKPTRHKLFKMNLKTIAEMELNRREGKTVVGYRLHLNDFYGKHPRGFHIKDSAKKRLALKIKNYLVRITQGSRQLMIKRYSQDDFRREFDNVWTNDIHI